MIEHAFTIRIVNVQNVIEIPESRTKSLGLIVMVKRIQELSFLAV